MRIVKLIEIFDKCNVIRVNKIYLNKRKLIRGREEKSVSILSNIRRANKVNKF